MRWRLPFVLATLLLSTIPPAGARTASDPESDEYTSILLHAPADRCHSRSVDFTSLETTSNVTHVTIVATLAGLSGVRGFECEGVTFDSELPVYSLAIGWPDDRSDRLSVVMRSLGPGAAEAACVQLTREISDDGRFWQVADGCFGSAYLDGDRVVLTGPMTGTATFGGEPSSYSVLPGEVARAAAWVRSGELGVTDSVWG